MPNASINALTAPDAVGPSSTIDTGRLIDHVNVDVVNQAILWSSKESVGPADPQFAAWGPEVYMLPGSRSIKRPGLVGFRFRAAVTAANLPAGTVQAVVTVEAVW
jgi:hypothetical protein